MPNFYPFNNYYTPTVRYVPYRTQQVVENHSRVYSPVTAYTADRPIYVNGVDINNGVYPVLNYQPQGASAPYIYVPIAQFSLVGAKVAWDPVKSVINVTSDYGTLQQQVQHLQTENQQLKTQLAAYAAPQQVGNTSGNLLNSGLAAQYGDWVFFTDVTDGSKLYKMRTDGSSKEKMTDDGADYINVIDGVLYFNEASKIVKMNSDGTGKTTLSTSTTPMVSQLLVTTDSIYYVTTYNNNVLYKMNLDGTGLTSPTTDTGIETFYVYDGWIYYIAASNDYKIYKMKTDGSMKTKVYDVPAKLMNVVGNKIYFVQRQGGGIYSMLSDGSELTGYQTQFTNPLYLNVTADGTIFYGYSDLYKFKPGTPPTDVKMTPIYTFNGGINVIGDWLYCRVFFNGPKLYRSKTDGTQGEIIQ